MLIIPPDSEFYPSQTKATSSEKGQNLTESREVSALWIQHIWVIPGKPKAILRKHSFSSKEQRTCARDNMGGAEKDSNKIKTYVRE